MYEVSYRCIYRDYWYDYASAGYLRMAVAYAQQLEAMGRTARIQDDAGNVLYETGGVNLSGL